MTVLHEDIELKQRRERIYTDYKDKVARYVRGKVSNLSDAEDIVSDVFVKVFDGLSGYDERRASLSTWIYTITRNTVTDYFRTAKKMPELSEDIPAENDIDERLLCEETLERLADALTRLSERQRDIIVLRYYGEKTLKDISAMLNISYGYTKLLHSAALRALRNMLDN